MAGTWSQSVRKIKSASKESLKRSMHIGFMVTGREREDNGRELEPEESSRKDRRVHLTFREL